MLKLDNTVDDYAVLGC